MVTQTISSIKPSAPRDEVRVTLGEEKVLSAPIGTSIEAVLLAAESQGLLTFPAKLVAAISNGRLRELRHALTSDTVIQPVLLSSSDGGRIYRRSLVMLLATAVQQLWNCDVSVQYAVPDGGFYCELVNHAQPTPEQLTELDALMRKLVTEDHPIQKRMVTLEDARTLFEERGAQDKVRLLEYRVRDQLVLYNLLGREDYYYGYMVPSTRYLDTFKLVHVQTGFVLQYPRQENPAVLGDMALYNRLSKVFAQADEWLERLGVEDIGSLNRLVTRDTVQELILVAEALHEQQVAYIAWQISQKHESEGAQLVLIAGPSSSGKTTFSRRLAIQIMAHGLRPFTLEMDNYFVDREATPRDENGEFDFESLYALDLARFNDDLVRMMAGEEVQMPRFDFLKGKSVPGRTVRLAKDQIIILEGIHGLNPNLVTSIPTEKMFRIYVSALTQLNIDMHNRVSTTDVRLLRRIVRDARTRGYSALDTLNRWRSVRRGEKRNIFPHQENADAMFNSALVYELAALRPYAEPLLLQVPPDVPAQIEANRLLSFLRWVQPFSERQQAMIPDTSLLREFMGGCILDNYHPGELDYGH